MNATIHRNVKVDSLELLDEAMNTMKQKGFINYYGISFFAPSSNYSLRGYFMQGCNALELHLFLLIP
jgi:hypothetical protein